MFVTEVPYDRQAALYNYIGGKSVDRVPNMNIAIHYAAKYADIQFGQFCTDY